MTFLSHGGRAINYPITATLLPYNFPSITL